KVENGLGNCLSIEHISLASPTDSEYLRMECGIIFINEVNVRGIVPAYLAALLRKKKQVGTASSSDVFIIELFSFPTKSWVYDTSCDNCHYAPTITRGVVSVSRLVDNGFVQCFTDCGISVSKNGVLYFNAVPRNGIYEIDMHDLVPNVNSIYNVSNKRVKHNLDSTYLWHCRLAHINKKRIKQLQQDGLLKSTDDESFDK
ncbi:retrotransposon protein, putative, ty1-copia subclass, partial [Tanacetum coccineum]